MGALPGFSFSPFAPVDLSQMEGCIRLGVSPSWSAPAATPPEISVASGNHDPGLRPLPGLGLGWCRLGVVGLSRCSCPWLCSTSSLWGLLSAWLWQRSKSHAKLPLCSRPLALIPPPVPEWVGRGCRLYLTSWGHHKATGWRQGQRMGTRAPVLHSHTHLPRCPPSPGAP